MKHQSIDIVDAFARHAHLSPEAAHPHDVSRFGQRSFDKAPFFGFIGNSYTKGGALFVGRNGALGSSTQHNIDNQKILEFTTALASKNVIERREVFHQLMEMIKTSMQIWNIYRYIQRFLSYTGNEIDYVAYINLVGFRCSDEYIPVRVLDEAWQLYTRDIVHAITPMIIIPLGSAVSNYLERLSKRQHREIDAKIAPRVHRSRGDRSIPERGENPLKEAASLYRGK